MGLPETISNLLLEQGRIPAEAALREAQIRTNTTDAKRQFWAQTLSSLANLGMQIPGMIQQAKTQGAERDALQAQTAERQQNLQTQQRMQQMSQFMNGLAQKYMTKDENGVATFDTDKMSQDAIAQGASGDVVAKLVTPFQGMNESVKKKKDAEADYRSEGAFGILNAIKAGMPASTAVGTALTHAGANGMITQNDAMGLVQALAQGQDITPMLVQWASRKHPEILKSEKVMPGESLVNPVTAKPTYTQPPKPVEVAPGGSLVQPDTGTPVYTAPERPKSLESKDVLLDGKPAKVTFDPGSGRYKDAGDQDVTDRIKPMPPASVVYPKPDQGTSTVELKPDSREYRIAKDLATGALTMADMQRMYGRAVSNAAMKTAIYDTARQLNPAFNPAQFELGFKMAGTPAMRQRIVAINALGPVIDKVEGLADQVGNGDIPAFNKLLMGAKFSIGDRQVTNFRQMQTLLGEEVGNALGLGTGSDLKTRLGLDLVNPSLGPKQFKDTMEQLRTTLEARKAEILKTFGPYGGDTNQGTPAGAEEWIRDKNGKLVKKGS